MKLYKYMFKQISIKNMMVLSILSLLLLFIINVRDQVVYITMFEVYLPLALISLIYTLHDSALIAHFLEYELMGKYTSAKLFFLRYTLAIAVATVYFLMMYILTDVLNGRTLYNQMLGDQTYNSMGIGVMYLAFIGTFVIYANVFSIARLLTQTRIASFTVLVVFFGIMHAATTWRLNIYSLLYVGDNFMTVKSGWVICSTVILSIQFAFKPHSHFFKKS